jgi:hypothetical protein
MPVDTGFLHAHRRLVIVIENDTIGDNLWCPSVSKSLIEYASLNLTALDLPHVYQSPNGNKLTVTGGTWCGELLTYEDLPHPKLSQEAEACPSYQQPSPKAPASD